MAVHRYINGARVPASKGMGKLRFASGDTTDIINVVVSDYKASRDQVQALALTLNGATVEKSAANVHAFVRGNIRYQLDPIGKQFSKTPARTIEDGFGDCKSYSILAASLLNGLGIKHAFKFVNYNDSHTNPTHVYVVAYDGNTPYIVDACLPIFNTEKQYNKNSEKLIMATEIHSLSGLGNTATVNPNRQNRNGRTGGRKFWRFNKHGVTSYADMDLGLLRENLHLSHGEALRKFRNPNHPIVKARAWALMGVTDAHDALRRGDYAEVEGIGMALEHGLYVPGESHKEIPYLIQQYNNKISGIGSVDEEAIGKVKAKKAKVLKKVGKAVAKKVGKTVKAAAKTAKKGVRAAVKVVTFPARIAAKGILEVTLPKAAPFFLYLFITNPDTINNLPAKVKKKRAKADKIRKFIVNAIGMKEAHFMQIVRNGIKKKMGADPETILKSRVKGSINGIFGIGAAPASGGSPSGGAGGGALVSMAAAASGLGPLLEILKVIGSVFKKSGESASAEDSPNPDEDFAGEEQVLQQPLRAKPVPKPRTVHKAALPHTQKVQQMLPKKTEVAPVRQVAPQPAQEPMEDWEQNPVPQEVNEDAQTAFEQTYGQEDYPEVPAEQDMKTAPEEVIDQEPEVQDEEETTSSSSWGDY